MFHRLRGDRFAVHFQDAGATAADAAGAAKGERAHAEPVVLEIKLDGVFAGSECFRAFPADALQVHQVPEEDRLAFQDVEAVATETATLRDEHAVAAAIGYLDFSLEVVG